MDGPIWKALADETRRSILDALVDGPKATGDLVELFPHLGRTTVMMHLDILTEAKLVLVKREGRMRWNHLNAMPIQLIYDRWVNWQVRDATTLASGLKSFVEKNNSPRTHKRKKAG